jgi:ribose transport system ATP-binding protein
VVNTVRKQRAGVAAHGRPHAVATPTAETTQAGGAAEAEPFLQVSGLSKAYGQVKALNDVSVGFRAGEVQAIVGENGAGKSTLTKLIGGEERPDAGQIVISGRPSLLSRPLDARRAGIAVVHQQYQLIETLTVAENICLEALPLRPSLRPASILDHAAMLRLARQRLAAFQLEHRAGERIRDLTVAEKQVVEICRALGRDARLLILDEPTSALSATESEMLFQHMRRLRASGVAVLFIAHNLSEVLNIADRISVLRDGRLIATVPAGALDAAALARLIVGREVAEVKAVGSRAAAGEVILGVSGGRHGGPSILGLRRGEILGLPTYIGSALRGFLGRISGERPAGPFALSLRGGDIGRTSIAARVRQGLCFVPADATAEGLVPKLSIKDNILLPNARRFTRFGILRRGLARNAIAALIRDLDIRPTDPAAPVHTLSGGNRQKVAIAKWLLSGAEVLVMEDPARGVDVGAKLELYRIMRGHVERRGAILFASSDLDELIGLSDSIVVIRGDEAVARFDNKPFHKASILAASSVNGASRAGETGA